MCKKRLGQDSWHSLFYYVNNILKTLFKMNSLIDVYYFDVTIDITTKPCYIIFETDVTIIITTKRRVMLCRK